MSARSFRLGLALFLMMSGLFAAKLALIAPGAQRPGRWSVDTSPPVAAQPLPSIAPEPKTAEPAAADSGYAASAAREAAAGAPRGYEPMGKDEESATHGQTVGAEPSLVIAVKRELSALGYAAGNPGGTLELDGRAAIMAFEADRNLPLTGNASQELLHSMLLGAPSAAAGTGAGPSIQAQEVIRAVQGMLARVGYAGIKTDGRLREETVAAIRKFEQAQGLKVTGRVSAELVSRLKPVARDAKLAAGR